jgi:TrmH family RNA methyltransferase
MALRISSTQNQRVKNLMALQKPRERREQGLFVIEGVREVSLALRAGFELESLWICDDIYMPDPAYPIDISTCEYIDITEEVHDKLAYREGSGGVLAVAKMRRLAIENLPKGSPDKQALYLVLEKVEKPGNIGAMLRTADAAGITGVIICDPATDFFNPNVIRGSVGTLFTVPVAAANNETALHWLRSAGIKTYAAALTAKKSYYTFDYRGPSAIVMGSESDGLSDFWLQKADEQIIIPMRGMIDSMNVSNAAAVLIFEAMRQRL